MASISYVLLEPEELVFHNVRLSQVYTQQLRITNTLRGPLELTIKPGSVERYTVTPSSLRLRGEESALVEVRLRVLRFAQKQKAIEQGHRDVFHIKGSHFDQKFYATFFLQPDADYVAKGRSGAAAVAGARVAPQARVSGRDASRSRSPSSSPVRERKAPAKSVSFADQLSSRSGGGGYPTTTTVFARPRSPGRPSDGPIGRYDAVPRDSSPPHVRGGLRQALSGLRSPQRSEAFMALAAGAEEVQLDALGRVHSANNSSSAATSPRVYPEQGSTGGFYGMSVAGPSGRGSWPAHGGTSASIDLGQLHGGATAQQLQTAVAAGLVAPRGVPSGGVSGTWDGAAAAAEAAAGSLAAAVRSRPPRGPVRSVPTSPRGNGASQEGRAFADAGGISGANALAPQSSAYSHRQPAADRGGAAAPGWPSIATGVGASSSHSSPLASPEAPARSSRVPAARSAPSSPSPSPPRQAWGISGSGAVSPQSRAASGVQPLRLEAVVSRPTGSPAQSPSPPRLWGQRYEGVRSSHRSEHGRPLAHPDALERVRGTTQGASAPSSSSLSGSAGRGEGPAEPGVAAGAPSLRQQQGMATRGSGVGPGHAGGRAALLRRASGEQPLRRSGGGGQRLAADADEPDDRWEIHVEEERTLGLHLVRSSLDNLSREIARQDKARDDRPPSPGSPGSKPWTDWRGSTSGVRSTANAGGTKADAWGERSRSPETMLPPPASRLSALIEQRAAARQAGQLGSYAADGERDSQRGSGDGPGMEGQQWAWDPRAEATGHGAGMQRGEASYLPRGRASGEQLWDAMGGQEIVEGEGLAPPPFPMVVRPASASSSSAGTQQPGEERLPERYEGPAGAQSTRLQRQASYEPQPPDPFAPMWARGKGSAPAQPWRAKVDPVPGPASAAAAAVTASGGRGDEGQVMELQLQVRSMERRQESLQKTVEQQQEVLRDKDMLLQALQSQLEAAKAKAEQAASGTPRVTDLSADVLASERAALLSERATLSARLAEAEAAAAASREEAAALRRLQLELQSRHPEVTRAVEAAVRHEQALQDERNRKALEMLNGKDARIAELESQVQELSRGGEQLRRHLEEARDRLMAAEQQVVDVLRQKEALVEAARVDRQRAETVMADLESRLASSNGMSLELMAEQERSAALAERLSAAERRAADAGARLQAAEARLQDAEAAQRLHSRQRDGQVDVALAMAEELRERSVAWQRQHAEAMQLQADAHSSQVARLEERIHELLTELDRARAAEGLKSAQGASPAPVGAALPTDIIGSHGPGPQRPGSAGGAAAPGPPALDPSYAGGKQPGAQEREESSKEALAQSEAAIRELRAANARLTGEAESLRKQLAAATASSKDRAWEQAELERLRLAVAERDVEVAELSSQVQVLKARAAAFGPGRPAGAAGGPRARAAGAGPASPNVSPGRPGEAARRAAGVPASPGRRGVQQKAGGAGAGAEAEVVEALRQQLAKSEAALRGAQERLAVMEAKAAVAQEAAGKGEQQRDAVHRSMVGSALEHGRLQQELDAARAAAVRLNARISDLAMAEQLARAEVDAAKDKLAKLEGLHAAETSTLQQRLARLTEHLAATQPEVLPVLLGPDYHPGPDPGPAGPHPTHAHPTRMAGQATGGPHHAGAALADMGVLGGPQLLSREAELEKAVEAAETAVAVMQGKLLAALRAAADASEEAARVRREAEWERDRLEAEVRAAREEGSLRIRTLEEGVARLGARGGEAATALAAATTEAEAAVRREARLRSELALAQQAARRANGQAAELRLQLRECENALREAQVYGGLLPFLYDVAAGGRQAGGQEQEQAAAASGARGSDGQAPQAGTARPPQVGGDGGEKHVRAGEQGAGLPLHTVSYHVLDAQLEVRLRQQAEELARRQQVIARLVDVAEQAQGELAASQAELERMKQVQPDPKQPLQQQYGELQRRLGALEADLRTCRDAKAAAELDAERLRLALAERTSELDRAAQRLAACERDVADREELLARRAIEVRSALSKEADELSRQAAEARRRADEAEAAAREAEVAAQHARAELEQARAELESQAAELRQARLQAQSERRAAAEATRQAKRAADVASQDAEQRRTQMAVLVETIEVLQAGNPGEREQRIASLTSQLAAASSQEHAAEQRAQALLADVETHASRCAQLQQQAEDLGQQLARTERQLAAAAATRQMLEGELAAVRSDIRTRDASLLRSARDLDERDRRVAGLEGELAALRKALDDCQTRHTDQLARERDEAAAAVRQARAESSAAPMAAAQGSRLDKVQASMDELMAWMEDKVKQQEAAAGAAGSKAPPQPRPPPTASAPTTEQTSASFDAAVNATSSILLPPSSWVLAALQRLKVLALESEREYLAAATDARVYRAESRWAWSRVQRLQASLEQRTGEWQIAQGRVLQLERSASRRGGEAAQHALEHVALQDRQLGLLADRLQATMGKLVVASSQAAGSEAALASANARLSALQRQLAVATAEKQELAARLAAADMEAAGSAEVLHLGREAALAQRDVAIRQYWDSQVAALVARPDGRDKVMALAREVCALKLSESQLQAALAAACHRADAASQLAAAANAARRMCEERLEQLMTTPQVPVDGSLDGACKASSAVAEVPAGDSGAAGDPSARAGGSGGGAGAGGLAVEVARLSAQLAAQTHEVFRLQEAALRAKQAYERRESDIQELQAQLAASELVLSQARAEGSSALLRLREQLTDAHEQDRQLLIRELREMQERLLSTRNAAAKEVALAEQRAASTSESVFAEAKKRVAEARDGQVDARQLRDMEARAVLAEREAARLATQAEALQAALTAAQAQVAELQDVKDVTGAAVASLEATLARVEKAATATPASGPGGGAPRPGSALAGGARRVSLSGSSGGSTAAEAPGLGPGQVAGATAAQTPGLAGLSRELVRAKMAEADAVRKMRASARSELDLRQKLLQRDERITQLKEQLAERTRAMEDLRRRALHSSHEGAGSGSGARTSGDELQGRAARSGLRSRSPSPVRGAQGAAPSQRPGVLPPFGARRRSLDAASSSDPNDPRVSVEAAEAEHLATQLAQMRLDLARKQAEIDRLQGALAEAKAAAVVPQVPQDQPQRPHANTARANALDLERTKDELAAVKSEMAAALTTANGILRRLGHSSSASAAVSAGGRGVAARLASPARPRPDGGSGSGARGAGVASGTLASTLQQLAEAVQANLLETARGGAARSPTRASEGIRALSELRNLSRPTSDPSPREPASPPPGTASLGVFEELRSLKHEYTAMERQRDELSRRCEQLARELGQCQGRVRELEEVADSAAHREAQEQASRLAGASHLSRLLQQSISSIHAMCDRVQAAVGPMPSAANSGPARQALDGLVSELVTLDATVGLLKAQLDKAAQGLPTPPQTAPTAAATPGTSLLYGGYGTTPGTSSSLSFTPLDTAGASAPDTLEPRRRIEPPTALLGARYADSRPEPHTTSQSPTRRYGQLPSTTPATAATVSSWHTATPGSALGLDGEHRRSASPTRVNAFSAGARADHGFGPAGGQSGGQDAAARAAQEQALAAAQAQLASLSSALAQHKARADKWKQRAQQLGSQLSLLNASMAAREAAVSERAAASGQQSEDELRKCKAEVARLQAALSGAEAARRELEAAHSARGSEARATVAHTAEAAARAATLQRQLETERAQVAAAVAAHQEEVAALKAAVAQEKGERARLLTSIRESHASAAQAGDQEARLKGELLEAHASGAAAKAAAERAEERASAWRSESQLLRDRLQQLERARSQQLSDMEARLGAAERRSGEATAVAMARTEELTAKLAATQAAAAAAPLAAEARLRELESQLATVQALAESVQRSARSEVRSQRLTALTRIARYQAALKQMQAETDAKAAEWERERAVLQVSASEGARRAEVLTAELPVLRLQAAELQSAADAERQELTARHVAHVQEMQRHIEEERRAMEEEAAARVQAAAAASESAAAAAGAARLAAVRAELEVQVAALREERDALDRELRQMQEQFREYQAQKASEVSGLEQRIRAYILQPGAAEREGRGAEGPATSQQGPGRQGCARARCTKDTRGTSTAAGSAASNGCGSGAGCGTGSRYMQRRQRPGPCSKAVSRRRRPCYATNTDTGAVEGLASSSQHPHAQPVAVRTSLASSTYATGDRIARTAGSAPGVGPGLSVPGHITGSALGPAHELALTRGSEALAAAQREVSFERLLRSRAEAQAGVLRSTVARMRAKIRSVSEQLAEARACAIDPEEHRQLQNDLSTCRDQLRNCRAESARRQKALQLLQSAAANPMGAAGTTDSTHRRCSSPPPSRPSAPMPFSPTKWDAAGAAAGGLGDVAWATAAGEGGGGEVAAAMEAVAAGARAARAALDAERISRQEAEGRLREAKAALERKSVLLKDMKRRMDELEAAAAARRSGDAAEASSEAKLRALQASMVRKDALVRELRERLAAAQEAAAADSAAAAAGGDEVEATRRAAAKLRGEVARKEVALKAAAVDLERERHLLSAATKQLDDLRRSEAAARRAAAAAAGVLRSRGGELLEALRALARLLLQGVAALDVARERILSAAPALQQTQPSTQPGQQRSARGTPGVAGQSAQLSAADISQLTSLSVDDVWHLLGPDALPPAMLQQRGGAGGGGVAAELHPLSNGAAASGVAVAASLEAAQRVGELLAVLEVALLAAGGMDAQGAEVRADGTWSMHLEPQRDGGMARDQVGTAVRQLGEQQQQGSRGGVRGGGKGQGRAGGDGGDGVWDPHTLQLLVDRAQAEVQRAEGGVAEALQRVGAL